MLKYLKDIFFTNSTVTQNKIVYNSYYDNTIKNLFFTRLKILILLVVTLGLAYPYAICIKENSRCSHTVINGHRLKFIGKPTDLLRYWFFWYILIILTCGLYGIVVHFKFRQWEVANTIFEKETILT